MSNPADVLDQAEARLERALTALEGRLRHLAERKAAAAGDDLFASAPASADAERLAEDLQDARARETALRQVAAEASHALGRAALELRAVLAAEPAPEAAEEVA